MEQPKIIIETYTNLMVKIKSRYLSEEGNLKNIMLNGTGIIRIKGGDQLHIESLIFKIDKTKNQPVVIDHPEEVHIPTFDEARLIPRVMSSSIDEQTRQIISENGAMLDDGEE